MRPEGSPASEKSRRGAAVAASPRTRIAEAAMEVLASHGVAGLTHRLVAARAGVSLAATTYHFESKFDIVAEASRLALADYAAAFRRASRRLRTEPAAQGALGHFASHLVRSSAELGQTRFLCWAEILLDAARRPESLALSREWFGELATVWADIARAIGAEEPVRLARSAVDGVIGLLLITACLELSPARIADVLSGGADPLDRWRIPTPPTPAVPPRRGGRKSAQTREAIVAAAIDTLIAEGPAAISYGAIAARAGLTRAAPCYHFPTIDGLLAAAQDRLFEDSKQRYRSMGAAQDRAGMNLEQLVDRTAAIFLREATEHGQRAIASFTLWLQATREPRLRAMVWTAIADQHLAWMRVLGGLKPSPRPLDALLAQALFLGKLLRIVATGSTTEDLARVRREFADDLGALVSGDFWI